MIEVIRVFPESVSKRAVKSIHKFILNDEVFLMVHEYDRFHISNWSTTLDDQQGINFIFASYRDFLKKYFPDSTKKQFKHFIEFKIDIEKGEGDPQERFLEYNPLDGEVFINHQLKSRPDHDSFPFSSLTIVSPILYGDLVFEFNRITKYQEYKSLNPPYIRFVAPFDMADFMAEKIKKTSILGSEIDLSELQEELQNIHSRFKKVNL